MTHDPMTHVVPSTGPDVVPVDLVPVDLVPVLDDICDRCAVPARLRVALRAGGELAFCGHHGNALAAHVRRHGARVTVEADFAWRGTAGARRTGDSVGQPAR